MRAVGHVGPCALIPIREYEKGEEVEYRLSGMIGENLSVAAEAIHRRNVDAGWWSDLQTGESLKGKRNVGEMLCLVHSEISEAMEGHRKGLMDDKLPHRPIIEVELADAVIRILDIAGGLDLDLGGAVAEKMEYNRKRDDHKRENRLKDGGKAY
jgi:NTP pyrophosphatase (non-canonical NTP hydrolase)